METPASPRRLIELLGGMYSRELGIDLSERDLGLAKGKGDPLDALRKTRAAEKARGYDFSDFEAALVRLGKEYCRKPRVTNCPMREIRPRLRPPVIRD